MANNKPTNVINIPGEIPGIFFAIVIRFFPSADNAIAIGSPMVL
ncbi:hypothetical protein [Youngiibacter fragilis]|nr:hypothetical protein [Youngiibacter fragilis]